MVHIKGRPFLKREKKKEKRHVVIHMNKKEKKCEVEEKEYEEGMVVYM
jgi:hypothetical protein